MASMLFMSRHVDSHFLSAFCWSGCPIPRGFTFSSLAPCSLASLLQAAKKPKGPDTPAQTAQGGSTTCFVGNLSWGATEDSLYNHFAAYTVTSARVSE